MKLIEALGNDRCCYGIISNYAKLMLALTELQKAMRTAPSDASEKEELERLRKMEIFAKTCCDCFTDFRSLTLNDDVKATFRTLRQETHTLDDMLAAYLKLNQAGKRIITDAAIALTVSHTTAKP